MFIAEDMTEEEGKYYPMMKVAPPQSRTEEEGKYPDSLAWDETELLYGKYLLQSRNPVLRKYLEREQQIKSGILKGLNSQNSARILKGAGNWRKNLNTLRKD